MPDAPRFTTQGDPSDPHHHVAHIGSCSAAAWSQEAAAAKARAMVKAARRLSGGTFDPTANERPGGGS